MTATIVLPPVVGTTQRAEALAGQAEGPLVTVDCRGLLAGSGSFARIFLARLFEQDSVREVKFVDVNSDFAQELTEAIGQQGLKHKVSVHRTIDAVSATA